MASAMHATSTITTTTQRLHSLFRGLSEQEEAENDLALLAEARGFPVHDVRRSLEIVSGRPLTVSGQDRPLNAFGFRVSAPA